jgi:hypothetical protein
MTLILWIDLFFIIQNIYLMTLVIQKRGMCYSAAVASLITR